MGKSQINLSIQMYYALRLGFYFRATHIFFFEQHLFLQFWRRVVQIKEYARPCFLWNWLLGLFLWSSGLLPIYAVPWLIELEFLPLLSHGVLPYVSQSHLARELCLFFIIIMFYLQKIDHKIVYPIVEEAASKSLIYYAHLKVFY